MPVDQRLDFDQMFQMQHILCSVSQSEVNFYDDTRKLWVVVSLPMARALLFVTKAAHNWMPQCSDECQIIGLQSVFYSPLPTNYAFDTG